MSHNVKKIVLRHKLHICSKRYILKHKKKNVFINSKYFILHGMVPNQGRLGLVVTENILLGTFIFVLNYYY